jgi:hypothetical protein
VDAPEEDTELEGILLLSQANSSASCPWRGREARFSALTRNEYSSQTLERIQLIFRKLKVRKALRDFVKPIIIQSGNKKGLTVPNNGRLQLELLKNPLNQNLHLC